MSGGSLANRPKVRRAEKEPTQADLAEPRSTMRKSIPAIEAGRMTPSMLPALEPARARDTSVEPIFCVHLRLGTSFPGGLKHQADRSNLSPDSDNPAAYCADMPMANRSR